jgi:hypothetical protein
MKYYIIYLVKVRNTINVNKIFYEKGSQVT